MGKKQKKSATNEKPAKKIRDRAAGSAPATPSGPDPRVTAIHERRRTKLRTARESATAAAELAGLDEQLEITNSELRGLDARRADVEQQLRDLLESIATAQLAKGRIRDERKRARTRAATARDEALTAERKYDRAVLAQLLDETGSANGSGSLRSGEVASVG